MSKTSLICPLCKGSGSLITFNPIRWWDCSVCKNAGVVLMFGPPEIKIHRLQNRTIPIQKFSKSSFKETDLMAHVLHRAGWFVSVGEAKRNGWNRPIEVGTFERKSKRMTVIITE